MFTFTLRRLALTVPTLLFISLIIFLLLELAPGDPMAQVPLTVPPEVKEKMRLALGLGEPVPVRFWKWIVQFFWIEPQVLIDHFLGTTFSEGDLRVISWAPTDASRQPRGASNARSKSSRRLSRRPSRKSVSNES